MPETKLDIDGNVNYDIADQDDEINIQDSNVELENDIEGKASTLPNKTQREKALEADVLSERDNQCTTLIDDSKTVHPALNNLSSAGTFVNLVIVSVSVVLLFSAYISFEILQSSLNEKEGLGTTSVSLLYSSMIVTGLLLPHMTLSYVSHKWVLVPAMSSYVLYLMTGFYATWATVVPASIIIGTGAAHLWLAIQEYIKELARRYAFLSGKSPKDSIGLFLGIFYGLFYTCNIFGNLVSSVVLRRQSSSNISNTNGSGKLPSCGAEFCPVAQTKSNSSLDLPPQEQIYMYVGVCVGFGCMAMALAALLLIRMSPREQKHNQKFYGVIQNVTKHLIQSRDQKLLVVPCIMRGIGEAFARADLTLAFVSCPYGIENIGFVMITYGVGASAFSVLFGRLWRKTGALPLFLLAYCVSIVVGVSLLLWQPRGSSIGIVYAVAVAMSMSDAMYSTLLSGIHCSHFENTSTAVSCLVALTAVGDAVSYGYSSFLCMRYKLYIFMAISTASFGCLLVFYVLKRRKKYIEEDSVSSK